jgi:signal peptidase I
MIHFLVKILSWLGWLLLGIVIVSTGFVLIASRYGWQFDAVLSGSMEPILHVGGLTVIKPINVQDIAMGDIISFKLPGGSDTICHRVIGITQSDGSIYFQTKGDANNTPDESRVPAANVYGKVVYHMPLVGNLIILKSAGTTPMHFLGKSFPVGALLVLVIAVIFIGWNFKDAIESIICPGKQWQREAIKKRNERYALRRRAFKL